MAGKRFIQGEIEYIKHSSRPNLTKNQIRTIKELKNNAEIIIKPADKGGAVVVMQTELYRLEAMRQLTNTKYYQPLDLPLHTATAETIYNILHRMSREGKISQANLNYLKADLQNITPRYFYLLPKIHKPRQSWPHPDMPAGRPIVSDCNSESTRVCELIDYFLQPVSTLHPSYLKDTYHFIERVKNFPIEPHWLLISADVESLYTNMQIDLILQSIKETFTCYPHPDRPDQDILELLEVTLRNNDFTFNGLYFLQICGIAMGRRYAPAAANIYLRTFDAKAMHDFRIRPKLYGRFLDDIFAVWPGTHEELLEFQDYLNSLIPGIKVTFSVRHQAVEFLDTIVYKSFLPDGTCRLQTKVFFKATDTHQLLHRTSFHPNHTFKGIVKSQFIRFKRISSTIYDYQEAAATLIRVLRSRGYNHSFLRRLKRQIWRHYDVSITRKNQENEEEQNEIIPVITHYDGFHSRLNRRWAQLIRANSVFNDTRVISAYRRHKNLRDYLVKGFFGEPVQPEDPEAMLDALLYVIQRDG